MRVGLVCPYSWDLPGGVQAHVRDLAEALVQLGHEVSVLAPSDTEDPPDLPANFVSAGRSVPVPYNGSIARMSFGPTTATRARRWVRGGNFDVLHVHEPGLPNLSMLACWASTGPIVGTFHLANPRSRAMAATSWMVQPTVDKVTARIAVSESARRTVVEHIGGDAVLIPNGVATARFTSAEPLPGWPGPGGTVGFLGRYDEPRKGFELLVAAMAELVAARPGLRLLVAGPGEEAAALAAMPATVRERVTMLGLVNEEDKRRMLRSVDVYVAPNTGGESFGIILTEAMAAGAAVVASDLEAFRQVLGPGSSGVLVPVGDVPALAAGIGRLLDDPAARASLGAAAQAAVQRFDWSRVAADVVAVYETVTAGGRAVGEDARAGRLFRHAGQAGPYEAAP
jgi:phosphatidylinositol alpha-mannosyltransferase